MTHTTCLTCGAPFSFDETKRGRHPKNCSRACTNQAFRARRSAAKQEERAAQAGACGVCGDAIAVSMRGAVARCCTRLCYEVMVGKRLAAPLPEVTCALPGCGVVFRPGNRRTRCCSERHGKALWNRESRADGRQPNSAWTEARRESYQRRRAIKYGADADRIRNREVFERDGWVCGLCQSPVDSDIKWPSPLSPSLDHILPLSKGGSHIMANVQLAHLGCNVEKGDRIPA